MADDTIDADIGDDDWQQVPVGTHGGIAKCHDRSTTHTPRSATRCAVCGMGSAWLMRTHDVMVRDNVWPDAATCDSGTRGQASLGPPRGGGDFADDARDFKVGGCRGEKA